MSIAQFIANAFDPARYTPPPAASAAAHPLRSDSLAGRTQFRPDSTTGLSLFDAAQARAMAKMDTDADGGLTATELAAGLTKGQSQANIDPAYFAALDKDSDGKLQLGELQPSSIFSMNTLNALLSAQENSGSAPPSARFEASNIGAWMVSEADQDGDGGLTAEEFAAVAPKGDYAAPAPGVEFPGSDILSKAGRAFFQADADKDGKLTGEELANVMETGPHRLTIGDATHLAPTLMGVADSNGDGALTLDEARAAAKTPGGLEVLFKQGDTDGDSKLSITEMKAMIDAKPTLYSGGLLRFDENTGSSTFAAFNIEPGDLALRALLLRSLDRVSETFRAQFEPPRTQTTA